MIQTHPILGIWRRAATTARIAMLAVGLAATWTAHAANCTDAPVSGGAYFIVNKDSGLQLDVSGMSQTAGADVVQWNANGQINQQWTLDQLSGGIWTMRAVHSKQALDVWNWDNAEYAAVKQYTYSGNSNQQWLLAKSGNAYTITSNLSKKLLTVEDKTAGKLLKQHSDLQGSGLQRWYFNPVNGQCSVPVNPKFGSFLGFNRILIGGLIDESTPGNPTPDTMNKAPWDLTYDYIHSPTAPFAYCYNQCDPACKKPNGGIDGYWWGCYKMSDDGKWNLTPAQKILDAIAKDTTGWKPINGKPHTVIHEWSWYAGEDLGRMQMRINQKAGSTNGNNDYAGAFRNQTLLKSYFDDYRLLLIRIGDAKNILHLEPDTWGFLRNDTGGNNPHAVSSPVKGANSADCSTEEDSLSGVASCLISMTHKYAHNSAVGLHFTCWDNGTAAKRQACLDYWKALGADKGDFIALDVKDRDAAWAEKYQSWSGSYWWSPTEFNNFVTLVKTVTEGLGKPAMLWQIPLGNANGQNWIDPNTNKGSWKDDKVQYIFDNLDVLAKAHVAALQFGAGYGGQTSTETDGGYLLGRALDYYNKGGVPLQ
jgi:hypothetical protein